MVVVIVAMAAVVVESAITAPSWAQQCSLNRPAVVCIAEASERGWK